MMNFINMNHIYIHLLSKHIINTLSKLQSYLHISVTCIKKIKKMHTTKLFLWILRLLNMDNLVLHYLSIMFGIFGRMQNKIVIK